jgi:hypothetical protein
MSGHKKKVRKAVEEAQRQLLGEGGKEKGVKKRSTREESDAALPRGEEHEAPGLIDSTR